MASLQLDIVTPDRLVLSKEVDYVGAPGIEGQFGVMANHIPFLSALAVGGLYYKLNEKEEYVFIAGGFAEVSDNKVTILAESAEEVATIDLARAEAAKKRAEQRLQEQSEDFNRARATSALSRAIHRIHLVNTHK